MKIQNFTVEKRRKLCIVYILSLPYHGLYEINPAQLIYFNFPNTVCVELHSLGNVFSASFKWDNFMSYW